MYGEFFCFCFCFVFFLFFFLRPDVLCQMKDDKVLLFRAGCWVLFSPCFPCPARELLSHFVRTSKAFPPPLHASPPDRAIQSSLPTARYTKTTTSIRYLPPYPLYTYTFDALGKEGRELLRNSNTGRTSPPIPVFVGLLHVIFNNLDSVFLLGFDVFSS